MSIQRYTNRTTPDGVWLDKADDGDWVLYADHLAALTAERERADRAELDTTWQDHADHWQKRAQKAEAERDALRERVARLVGALRTYGRHSDSCGDADAYNGAQVRTCGCGLDAALGDK